METTLKTLRARNPRKTDRRDPRQRSFQHGFDQGAAATKVKILCAVSAYLNEEFGKEFLPYSATLEETLTKYV